MQKSRRPRAVALGRIFLSFGNPRWPISRLHRQPRSIRLVTHNSDLVLETSAIHDILDPNLVDSDHLTTTRRQIFRIVRNQPVIDEDVLFAFNSFTLSYGHHLLTSLPLIFAFESEIKEDLLKIVFPAGYPR
jgi:hypothetical protein